MGRHIEAVLPAVLLFSFVCLVCGELAQRGYPNDNSFAIVPVCVGVIGILSMLILIAYLIVARPDLLRRIKVEYHERLVPIVSETAASEIGDARRK